MKRWRAVAETVHLTALGLWLGALVMTGLMAATLFPMMKGLDPRLPAYEKYTGEHWMIAAGQPMAKIFLYSDILQFACATLCIFTMGVLLFKCRISMRRPSGAIRVLALATAICLLGGRGIYLSPRMELNMRGYWEAALQGNNTEAAKFKDVFSADHPTASRLMGGTAVALLLAMLAGAWSASTPGVPAPPSPAPPRASKYEEPRLLRGKR